jgi:hypothetical protein
VWVAILLSAGAPTFAQQGTASITGTITDEQNAVLPGVSILVTNEENGTTRETVSGGNGTYLITQIVPGRYRIRGTLAGFRTVDRGGLVVSVGNTLTLNLSLPLEGIAETVRVSAQAPLIDTKSATVGGNIGVEDLSELPAMNRNYFATVALLPGVQFSASANMGNDTIAASGQSTQGNNVSVDGGYNGDDGRGTSAGAQVRTPLEAVQEFQVITSMYDAEWGRASGAIVNAVTKSGTNDFRGSAFVYSASNKLTSEDYFVRTGGLAKPTITKRDWGGVAGGPIVRNKAFFFFSLERQIDNPNVSQTYPTRPALSFSLAQHRSDWNTLVRFDHQINSNHTWAVRWLREGAPQFPIVANRQTIGTFSDESDLDQLAVGTLTSVLGTRRVNTFRVGRTWEHFFRANVCFRDQGPAGGDAGFKAGAEDKGDQSLCPPQLSFISFVTQGGTSAGGPWDSNYDVEDDMSWFFPTSKGNHDTKYGVRYNYTDYRNHQQGNRNGTFTINSDLPFDPTNASTYPERLAIRVGTQDYTMISHALELYGQDKWTFGRTTLSLGARYDLEITPLDESANPLFAGLSEKYPIDRNNISPRIGVTHSLDADGKSVIRGGYGIFYNRTILGTVEDVIANAPFTNSFTVNFPADAADPGPSRGQFPTDPFLVNGPVVNRALLNARYPPGTIVRNDGDVTYDNPNRKQPWAHQFTVGYSRQLGQRLAVTADYVRMLNRDMFLSYNLYPMVRANTSRTGRITRVDAFNVLGGADYNAHVWTFSNLATAKYDALNLSLEKRYSQNWSGRVSYSLSSSRGTGYNQADQDLDQVLTDLHLDKVESPTGTDRHHVLSLSGRTLLPHSGGIELSATARYMSGVPMTIINSAVDVDQNGELQDPAPAGTYSGTATDAMQNVEFNGKRGGARGPDYFQLDMRAGWRRNLGQQRTFEIFMDLFNVTNRANFVNPATDIRQAATFLRLTRLYGGSGFPRQAELGLRFAF